MGFSFAASLNASLKFSQAFLPFSSKNPIAFKSDSDNKEKSKPSKSLAVIERRTPPFISPSPAKRLAPFSPILFLISS
jgi:hypothetical protein